MEGVVIVVGNAVKATWALSGDPDGSRFRVMRIGAVDLFREVAISGTHPLQG